MVQSGLQEVTWMTEAGTADGGYDAQRLFDNNDFMMSAALTGDTRSTKCRSRSFLLL